MVFPPIKWKISAKRKYSLSAESDVIHDQCEIGEEKISPKILTQFLENFRKMPEKLAKILGSTFPIYLYYNYNYLCFCFTCVVGGEFSSPWQVCVSSLSWCWTNFPQMASNAYSDMQFFASSSVRKWFSPINHGFVLKMYDFHYPPPQRKMHWRKTRPKFQIHRGIYCENLKPTKKKNKNNFYGGKRMLISIYNQNIYK